MPVIVTWQNGAPVRVSDVATAIDSVENDKVASWLNGTRPSSGVYRQPDANTVRWSPGKGDAAGDSGRAPAWRGDHDRWPTAPSRSATPSPTSSSRSR